MLLKNGRTSSPDKPQNCNIHHVLRKMDDFLDMGQYIQIFKKGPSKICGRKLLKDRNGKGNRKDEIFGGYYYCISTSLFQKKN